MEITSSHLHLLIYNSLSLGAMSDHFVFSDFDTDAGSTASELVQGRTDARAASIQRPGVKINVMSEEDWNRRMAEIEERRQGKQCKID
jgi:hypothetical protein